MNKAKIISFCGSVPLLGSSLRKIARRYPEGSTTIIKNGHLAGYRWKRSHRYVSSYWLGTYELPIQECLVRELRPGDIFYDIGANAGFFSLLGSKCVGPAGKVFSFEPLAENIHSLRSQLALNNGANCTVVEAAVSDHAGYVEFSEGKDTSTAHIREAKARRGDGSVASVKAVTLDEFLKEGPPPDFVKMDIEGAEVLALRGARDLLRSVKPPKILIEFHGEQLKQEGLSILKEFGYNFCSLQGGVFRAGADERHIFCVPEK